jgi:hypothetical protein
MYKYTYIYTYIHVCLCARAHTHTLIANVRWDIYGVHIGHLSDPPPYMGQMSNIKCPIWYIWQGAGAEGPRVTVYVCTCPILSVSRCSLEAASH